MARRNYWLKISLPVAVLAGAVLVAGYLQATKPQLQPEAPAERAWFVATTTAEIGDLQPEFSAYGEIVARRDVEMRALVAGAVIGVGENFVDGGRVSKGDLLVAIDPFEYDAALAESRAGLTETQAQLAETEADLRSEVANLAQTRIELEIAERELRRREKLVKEKVVSEKALDDTRMLWSERSRIVARGEQSVQALEARGRRTKAAIERARVSLRRAQRDLENTQLKAPYDGYLTETTAAIGKRLGVNDRVGRLLDLERLEARFLLSDAEYGRLSASGGGLSGRPVRVIWHAGDQAFAFAADLVRAGGEIDPASGGVTAYAELETPGPSSPLRPGAFVEIWVRDRLYPQVARLPETALNEGDTVYVVVDGRLQPRLIEVVARIGNDIIVRGELAHGEEVAITRFPEIGPDIKVSVR